MQRFHIPGSGFPILVLGSRAPVPRCDRRCQRNPHSSLMPGSSSSPSKIPAHETRVYWLGEASAMLLADNLNAQGSRAYTRDERLDAFEQLQLPPVASLSHATVIRLGQVVGATHVVIGSFTLSGGRISVRAQNIRLDSGRMEKRESSSRARSKICSRSSSASADASLVQAGRAGLPDDPRCRCSRATSRGCWRPPRPRRSAISKRRSSSIPASIARVWRCGR